MKDEEERFVVVEELVNGFDLTYATKGACDTLKRSMKLFGLMNDVPLQGRLEDVD